MGLILDGGGIRFFLKEVLTMNRTREIVTPSEALKLVASTLNNPSIRHERIDMQRVYTATAAVLNGGVPGRLLTITVAGVVVEGLAEILAAIHAWKPVTMDVARGVPGERAYTRLGPQRAPQVEESVTKRIDLLRGRR